MTEAERHPFWKPTLEWYSNSLKKCHCGGTLTDQPLNHYDHAGGWWVGGFKRRQWLSVKCPECKRETSFHNLNIAGKATFEEQLLEEIRCEGHVTSFKNGYTSQQLEAWLLGKEPAQLSDTAKSAQERALEVLKSLRPISGTDPDFDYEKSMPKS